MSDIKITKHQFQLILDSLEEVRKTDSSYIEEYGEEHAGADIVQRTKEITHLVNFFNVFEQNGENIIANIEIVN